VWLRVVSKVWFGLQPSTKTFAMAHEQFGKPIPTFKSDVERTAFFTEATRILVIGYARSDIIHNKHMVWNSNRLRDVSDEDVRKLMGSIENGAEKFRPETAIPIVLSRSWLIPNQEFLNEPAIDFKSLPVLSFSLIGAQALKEGEFRPEGGNHRQDAIKQLKIKYNTLIKELSKARSLKDSEVQELERLKEKRGEFEEWLFIVYDKGGYV
jgi:ribosomal protein S13